MQFMLLIHSEGQNIDPAELPRMTHEYMEFAQDLVKTGGLKGGDRLESSSTTATVRVRDGKTVATDGPFAETREQIGGYFIVEAKDRDEAVAIAAKIPGARYGSIEVRQIASTPSR